MRKSILLLSLFFITNSLIAQDNPFLSKEKSSSERKKVEKTLGSPRFTQKIFSKIALFQRSLNKRLSELTRQLKEKKSTKLFFLILFVTFVYGVVHALGPGHGKTLTFSYFLSQETTIKKGITVGLIIGFLHAASALTLVLILYFTVKKAYFNNIENASRAIKIISYSLITCLGLFLLIKNLYQIKMRKNIEKKELQSFNDSKSIIPFSVAVGLIPCPGTTIILLFSLSLGILKIGIISTFFMALGMATTISSAGILTIFAKDNIKKILSKKDNLLSLFQRTVSVLGAFFIFTIGILLLLGVYVK